MTGVRSTAWEAGKEPIKFKGVSMSRKAIKSTEPKEFTITLTPLQVKLVEEVLSHRRAGDFNSLLTLLMEQGANSLLYRYQRNKAKWANRGTEVVKEQEGTDATEGTDANC
jgi:hypothetical protein